MPMKRLFLVAGILLAGACRGTAPRRNAPPEHDISAILISCKTTDASGQMSNGRVTVNLESSGGRQKMLYRFPLHGGQTGLYTVEPGVYRLAPTRSIWGFSQRGVHVVIADRKYSLPLPAEILSRPAYEINPGRIMVLGSLEARVLPGRNPSIAVRLDDSAQTRRAIVQGAIADMMDMRKTMAVREGAIAWRRALQLSLMDILSEK